MAKSYYQRPNPPPIKQPPMPKAPTSPPKAPLEPRQPAMPPPASLLEQLADSRDRNRIAHRAKAQVAKVGKTASTCLLTGLSASAATELGANGQQMESMDPSSTSVDLHQIAFTFVLGIGVGMILLRYLQTGSISTALHRPSGYFRFIWRFTYFLCRTLSICTCNCACWFRRHQNSVDRIYDQMANKGKGKGKTPFRQRRRVTLTTGLASTRICTIDQILHGFRK